MSPFLAEDHVKTASPILLLRAKSRQRNDLRKVQFFGTLRAPMDCSAAPEHSLLSLRAIPNRVAVATKQRKERNGKLLTSRTPCYLSTDCSCRTCSWHIGGEFICLGHCLDLSRNFLGH